MYENKEQFNIFFEGQTVFKRIRESLFQYAIQNSTVKFLNNYPCKIIKKSFFDAYDRNEISQMIMDNYKYVMYTL